MAFYRALRWAMLFESEFRVILDDLATSSECMSLLFSTSKKKKKLEASLIATIFTQYAGMDMYECSQTLSQVSRPFGTPRHRILP